MVGEALKETTQQRRFHTDANAVPPFSIYQHAQQMPMQVIHRVVTIVQLRGFLRVTVHQHLSCTVTQRDCHLRHVGEAVANFLRKHLVRILASGDLGNMHSQRTHALGVGDDLHRTEDFPQLAGHRMLQRQQRERFLFDLGSHRHDPLMVTDYLFSGANVGLEQSLRCAFHRYPGQAAHLSQSSGQLG
ncbi:Uncharacterised protein [Mycobacterium tuberculosis]|nr:Uncharacterised protein [Mycobacterium tuberculosis]